MKLRHIITPLAAVTLFCGCSIVGHIVNKDYDKAAEEAAVRTEKGIAAGNQNASVRIESMSPENRYYVGRGVASRIFETFPLAEPGAGKAADQTEYLNELGQYLALVADMPDEYRGQNFGLLNSSEPAAYSTPGGFTWIGTGIIKLCGNEDELAAVIAHELGHGKNMHAIRQFIAKGGTQDVMVGFGAALEGDAAGQLYKAVDEFLGVSEAVAEIFLNNDYSTEFEYEADACAVDTLANAGYDPSALVTLLGKIKGIKDNPGKYVAGHPPAEERIRRVKARITEKHYTGSVAAQRTARFKRVFGS